MKLNNPIGPKTSMGHGYYYQRIGLWGRYNSYVKIWFCGEVIDRALTVKRARRIATLHYQRSRNLPLNEGK